MPLKCRSHHKTRLYGELRGETVGLRFDMRVHPVRQLKTLPRVRVVDTFVIRRQCLRYFSVPKTLQPIIQSLTQLKHLRYEHWGALFNSMGPAWLRLRDEEHALLFGRVLHSKRTLKSVACYEDMTSAKLRSQRTPRIGLARALVESSQRLEELHFAHNVDAKDFFSHVIVEDPHPNKGMEWKKLERISLTSVQLKPDTCNLLILQAATVAQRMPKLQRMELWHADASSSCMFQYKADPEQPVVRFSSTWFGRLGGLEEKVWQLIASKQGSRHQLMIEYKLLDQNDFSNRNSILRFLDQGDRLLNATSRHQLLNEGVPSPVLKMSILATAMFRAQI
ncbi:hypothetical protein N0V84_006656 [Fusarium piperis]|uniref:DUF6546 domain-containing protein n=1 Tax=Fusarium piperis TaxID=1435070 RepID=A0A9W8WBQ2_9HYPO|nr:hypothetical protein N0V84_006656 [Fusarium piperis]